MEKCKQVGNTYSSTWEPPSNQTRQGRRSAKEWSIYATQAFQMRRMHYIIPAFIALMWGQRIGDVLELRASLGYKVDQHVSVCFVEGKTVAETG